MENFTKSIKAILYDRLTSPLFGTLISTWCVWNWKILYLTAFVSEKMIKPSTKIEYIVANYTNSNNLYWWPILSTAFLLLLMPFVSNGAYWLSITFDKWKYDQKLEVDSKKLLTIEQSVELRKEMADVKISFDNILKDKNSEIEVFKIQLEKMSNNSQVVGIEESLKKDDTEDKEIDTILRRIKSNEDYLKVHGDIVSTIQGGYNLSTEIDSDSIAYYELNDLIKSASAGHYNFTPKGKKVARALLKS